jgi:hypothetical protein
MAAPARPRLWVQSWDPAYGSPSEESGGPPRSGVEVDAGVERAEAEWAPVEPGPAPAADGTVLFIDGVRRIDAMGWIGTEDAAALEGVTDTTGGSPQLALLASYAAGVVRCAPGRAEVVEARVFRGVFSGAAGFGDVPTSAGAYAATPVPVNQARPVAQQLSLAVVDRMRRVEAELSWDVHADVEAGGAPELLVVDGPLDERVRLPRTLGYVKTHGTDYLEPAQHRMAGLLPEGCRTPLFRLAGRYPRYSWYLRLPGGSPAPWAGVVRVECSAALPTAEVVELAGRSQSLLCRYASTEYKDSRAPQNLHPIAGLERQLRRRLGDQALLYRAIRAAAG